MEVTVSNGERGKSPVNEGNIVPITAGGIVVGSIVLLAIIAVAFRGYNY